MSQPRLIEPPARKQKLLHEVRSVLRTRHLSLRTEQAYVQWIRRFILFHNKRHPSEMGEPEIREFISDLGLLRASVMRRTGRDRCTDDKEFATS